MTTGPDLAPEALRLKARFWAKVQKTEDCWVWTAAKDTAGYGLIRIGRRLFKSHRVAYEMTHGPIPAGMQVDHRCQNRACVRPEHLRVVTDAQNRQHLSAVTARSKSGHRGVSWYKRARKWMVHAKVDGKKHFGGYYVDLDEAIEAAHALRDRIMTHHNPDFG